MHRAAPDVDALIEAGFGGAKKKSGEQTVGRDGAGEDDSIEAGCGGGAKKKI